MKYAELLSFIGLDLETWDQANFVAKKNQLEQSITRLESVANAPEPNRLGRQAFVDEQLRIANVLYAHLHNDYWNTQSRHPYIPQTLAYWIEEHANQTALSNFLDEMLTIPEIALTLADYTEARAVNFEIPDKFNEITSDAKTLRKVFFDVLESKDISLIKQMLRCYKKRLTLSPGRSLVNPHNLGIIEQIIFDRTYMKYSPEIIAQLFRHRFRYSKKTIIDPINEFILALHTPEFKEFIDIFSFQCPGVLYSRGVCLLHLALEERIKIEVILELNKRHMLGYLWVDDLIKILWGQGNAASKQEIREKSATLLFEQLHIVPSQELLSGYLKNASKINAFQLDLIIKKIPAENEHAIFSNAFIKNQIVGFLARNPMPDMPARLVAYLSSEDKIRIMKASLEAGHMDAAFCVLKSLGDMDLSGHTINIKPSICATLSEHKDFFRLLFAKKVTVNNLTVNNGSIFSQHVILINYHTMDFLINEGIPLGERKAVVAGLFLPLLKSLAFNISSPNLLGNRLDNIERLIQLIMIHKAEITHEDCSRALSDAADTRNKVLIEIFAPLASPEIMQTLVVRLMGDTFGLPFAIMHILLENLNFISEAGEFVANLQFPQGHHVCRKASAWLTVIKQIRDIFVELGQVGICRAEQLEDYCQRLNRCIDNFIAGFIIMDSEAAVAVDLMVDLLAKSFCLVRTAKNATQLREIISHLSLEPEKKDIILRHCRANVTLRTLCISECVKSELQQQQIAFEKLPAHIREEINDPTSQSQISRDGGRNRTAIMPVVRPWQAVVFFTPEQELAISRIRKTLRTYCRPSNIPLPPASNEPSTSVASSATSASLADPPSQIPLSFNIKVVGALGCCLLLGGLICLLVDILQDGGLLEEMMPKSLCSFAQQTPCVAAAQTRAPA